MAKPATEKADEQAGAGLRFRAQDGLGIAGGIALVVAALAVTALVMGLSKRFARETIPEFVNLPAGSWAMGGVLGPMTALGATGGLRAASAGAGTTRPARALHAIVTAVCCAAAFGPFLYLLSGLPGKNCSSSGCAYIPGTGTAFLAYAVSAGVAGWLLYRCGRARAGERAVRERERARRLRKRRKGKNRTVLGR